MKVVTHVALAGLIAGAMLAAACGSGAPPREGAPAGATGAVDQGPPPFAETAYLSSASNVFFIEPANGANVKSPVKLKFGVKNLEVSAVPAGEVTTPRPGVGHFHIGVDTECLPPGALIPKAAPWVHFGNGTSEIDMQLPKGQHKLALEAGDDLHSTFMGFCTTIMVNVTE